MKKTATPIRDEDEPREPTMKSSPIIFSAEMVDAILEGRKTVTRRIVLDIPKDATNVRVVADVLKWGGYGKGEAWGRIPSPYGDVGCELWVRENFWHWGRWGWIEGTTKTGRLRERFFEEGRKIAFGQEEPEGGRAQVRHLVGWHRRPAIYLPKWAPRIRLEVVSLRVERLQAITEEDARAEGVLRECDPNDPDLQFEGNGGEDVGGGHGYTMPRSFVCGFANLWERINGDRAGWDTDPWVWRIGFKLKRSLDQAFARAQDDHEEAGAAGDADLPTGTLFDAATVMRYERIDPETPEE